MGPLIDSIDKNFQRLLRWAYPGILFLVLLHMSRPGEFVILSKVIYPWGLITAGLIAGAVIYLCQGYIFNQIVSHVALCLRWELNADYKIDGDNTVRCKRIFGKLLKHADLWASICSKRWGQDLHRLDSYLNYAWAIYHATALTGWLVLIFFFVKGNGSPLAKIESWIVLLIGVLLLEGALWLYAWLSRVPIPETQTESQQQGVKPHVYVYRES